MQQDSENDFIRRKYRWHLLWLFLTLSIIALILGLDINCVIIQLDPKQLIYTILEIIFCLLIFVLTCMELRYFYRIKQNNFSFTYSSIISQKCLKVIIFCLGIIFFTNVIIVLIYIAFEIMNIESLNSCHYFSLTNKITKLIISIIIIFGYLIMIHIPLKIRKTLILLSNQKQNLVQDIFLNDNEGDFLDITPNDGNFCIIKTQKPQNVLYLPSSELKKFICKICISKIKNNQNIVKISCSHIFHEQCFNKYALSIMKQQSFILTCKVCDQGVNIDKQEFYVIKELKSKIVRKN